MQILDLETSCTSQGLANTMFAVGNMLNIICIIVPILLMISLIIKVAKMVKDPDNKKGLSQIKNSIIAAVIIFFIPTFLNILTQAMGEKYNISSCWMLAQSTKYTINNTSYMDIDSKDKNPVYTEPDEYQKGKPKPKETKGTNGTSGPAATTVSGGITTELGNRLVEVARTQIGVPYHTMHYGPKGSGNEGFGCAMFVSYCYNQVFFGGVSGQDYSTSGFFGSTYEYWGNVTRDGYNAHNQKFVEVQPSQAQAGDVITFLRGNDHYSSHDNCYHVGLYIGNGQMIDSSGSGTSGRGVAEGGIDINRSDIHFLRYVGR